MDKNNEQKNNKTPEMKPKQDSFRLWLKLIPAAAVFAAKIDRTSHRGRLRRCTVAGAGGRRTHRAGTYQSGEQRSQIYSDWIEHPDYGNPARKYG